MHQKEMHEQSGHLFVSLKAKITCMPSYQTDHWFSNDSVHS